MFLKEIRERKMRGITKEITKEDLETF